MTLQTSLTGCGKRIIIKPVKSRLVLTLVCCVHSAALLLLLLVDLNSWLLLAIAALIIFNLYSYLGGLPALGRDLSLQYGKALLVQMASNSWQEVEVKECFITSWLIVLRVRTLNDTKLHSLVYAVDSMDRQSFRRLRAYLNHFILTSSSDVSQ